MSLNFMQRYTKPCLTIFVTSILMVFLLLATPISITYAQNTTQVQRPNTNTTTTTTNTTATNNNSANNTNTNTNTNVLNKTAARALGNTTIDTFHAKGTVVVY